MKFNRIFLIVLDSLGVGEATATVNGKVAAKAELTFAIAT